jgi:hypothetical protein
MLESGTASTNSWRTFTQTINDVVAGQVFSGYAAFDWNDYDPFFDAARVRITGTNVDDIAWFKSGESFPNTMLPPYDPPPYYISDSYVPWELWSWIAPAAGTYVLEYGVTNSSPAGTADSAISSYAYFDAIPTVPEPSSLALFAIGLAALSSMQRRSRTV